MRIVKLIVIGTFAAGTALLAQGRGGGAGGAAQTPPLNLPADTQRVTDLKTEAAAEVEKLKDFSQQMVDQIFSYGELGFQEFETSKYLVTVLKQNGFKVEEGVAGIPTAFIATWGSGKPVIALGSDIDGIPQSSQTPGVAYRKPLVEGAPGHGEGHNSGQAVNITAAIVLKKIMEREKIPGTIRIWPGVAEELVGTKAYFIRDGLFKDVDVALFTHVGRNLSVSWGDGGGTGLVSVLYSFKGESSHAAGSPWRGKSALDAVELMNVGWNYRREHLPLSHRSHYVIKDGGDQPNVVPPTASVWYYFRQVTYPGVKEMWAAGDQIAAGAAMMTNTTLEPTRVLGSAWPRHFNRAVAQVTHANIEKVGLPVWSDDDQAFARAVQKELGVNEQGLALRIGGLGGPTDQATNTGGGSDDIGDISWNVPTVTLSYPSNVPGLPGHNWADGMAMATPIAHKGVTAGAKVQAMTLVDLVMKPEVITAAWDYFKNVQTRTQKYEPLIRPQDKPAIELNRDIMAKYRDQMRPLYYDPAKYKTYLEQLGIKYPVIKK
jgi:aminobenzoyl-glutamate utilization protein B